jgi:hypothetical protein
MLRSQDNLVLLKVIAIWDLTPSADEDDSWTAPKFLLKYSVLGTSVGISTSQAFESVRRLIEAGLIHKDLTVRHRAAAEWLIHGVKYFQPPIYGGLTRGMLTSYAAEPLKVMFLQPDLIQEPPPVWPLADGVRGIAFEPIYKMAPLAAERDGRLKEYLVLLDAIRSGRSRESAIAIDLLKRNLGVT